VSEQNFDPVQRPSHYNQKGRETIDVLRDIAEKFIDPWVACLVYQASKYLMRFEFKNGVQDLEKCIWYIKELASYRYPDSTLAKEHRRVNRPTSDEYKEQKQALLGISGHCDRRAPVARFDEDRPVSTAGSLTNNDPDRKGSGI
jgi:hypothetical protein